MTQSSASEREYSQDVQDHATDRETGLVAPYPVTARLLALAGTADVQATTCRTYLEEAGARRTWEAIWLLSTSLVYVRASRADVEWNAIDDVTDGKTAEGDDVTSWRRPLHAIAAISVDDVTTWRDNFRDRWAWTAPLRVTFLDGASVEVPAVPRRRVMGQAGSGLTDLGRLLLDRL